MFRWKILIPGPLLEIYWIRLSGSFWPRNRYCKKNSVDDFYPLSFENLSTYSGFPTKSLDKVEYLISHLLLNSHPLVAGFPGSGNYNRSSHALIPFKRKIKRYCWLQCKYSNRAFLQLAESPRMYTWAPGKELHKCGVMETLWRKWSKKMDVKTGPLQSSVLQWEILYWSSNKEVFKSLSRFFYQLRDFCLLTVVWFWSLVCICFLPGFLPVLACWFSGKGLKKNHLLFFILYLHWQLPPSVLRRWESIHHVPSYTHSANRHWHTGCSLGRCRPCPWRWHKLLGKCIINYNQRLKTVPENCLSGWERWS